MLTPPVIGRISIGRVVERNGKRFPEKDDQFTITSQIQNKDGWITHPVDEVLRKESANQKLRSIPVSLIFDNPELNFRAEYNMFDRESSRLICAGDGETCRRLTAEGQKILPCPSPVNCSFAQEGICKPYGRLYIKIQGQDDVGTFVFKTTGFNSIRTLSTRLRYYQAISRNRLSCLPLELKVRGKSTALSFRLPIYYADLTLRDGMSIEEAIQYVENVDSERKRLGFQQNRLDEAALQCLNSGGFEYTLDESMEIVDEFYPELNGEPNTNPEEDLHSLHEKITDLLECSKKETK